MKRLNKIARRIISYDKAVEKFVKQCKDSGRFDDKQIKQLQEGLLHHLTMEEIKLYADPKFNYRQMEEIREGFDAWNDLPIQRIKIYADPKFSWEQMAEIRRFAGSIPMEQVRFMANPKYDANLMYEIGEAFKDWWTIDEVKKGFNL